MLNDTSKVGNTASIRVASINRCPLPVQVPSDKIRNVRADDVVALNFSESQVEIVDT